MIRLMNWVVAPKNRAQWPNRPPQKHKKQSLVSGMDWSAPCFVSMGGYMGQNTMQAAVVRHFQAPLQIEELPVPVPGRNQILIRTEACGVCHTDLHAADGDWPIKPGLPFVPGHEGVGKVVAVGEGVQSFKVGDRAGIAWLYSACGECEWCITGWETLCPKAQYGGYSVNGAFAEYVVADAR
jgi:propanol-preferring alcohol dehydrogenase